MKKEKIPPFEGSAREYKAITEYRKQANGVRISVAEAPASWKVLTDTDFPSNVYFAMKQLEDSRKPYAVLPCGSGMCVILTSFPEKK